MQQAPEDRRQTQTPLFPLTDSSGHKVEHDRRSGKDRRKERRGSDVARKIINLLH